LFDRWQTFRELRVLDRKSRIIAKSHVEEEFVRAGHELATGHREQALAICNGLRRQFPERFLMSKAGLKVLLDLGAFGEVDSMMEEGRRRYPGYDHFAVGQAMVAHRRGDLQEALDRCEIVRRKFPDATDGYTIATLCLDGLARHRDAEAMIGRAVANFPRNFEVLLAYAKSAMRHQDWQRALERWEMLRDQYTDAPEAINIAECLRHMGRYDEAEKIATDLARRFPGHAWVYAELAQIATYREDWDAAVRYWEITRRRNPYFVLGYTAGIEAARRLDREADADTILTEGLKRLKSNLSIHLEYARTAQHRGDWSTAAERWALVRERFPDCEEAREQEAKALASLAAPGQSKTGTA
jgi:tetratricopeptide (TPR) repeat protein